ncbi:MAG: hypothetical protein QF917_03770 [Candidatus Woesearchaeota archaeon]|jgi:hypothetical protein|nr:hypothetical protein [Candidatus Woesearchaeota archaeon]|tara:strand:+ start:730 stop:1239 length:510 start_codon:yes stop_codon:yes gene_type:complete
MGNNKSERLEDKLNEWSSEINEYTSFLDAHQNSNNNDIAKRLAELEFYIKKENKEILELYVLNLNGANTAKPWNYDTRVVLKGEYEKVLRIIAPDLYDLFAEDTDGTFADGIRSTANVYNDGKVIGVYSSECKLFKSDNFKNKSGAVEVEFESPLHAIEGILRYFTSLY